MMSSHSGVHGKGRYTSYREDPFALPPNGGATKPETSPESNGDPRDAIAGVAYPSRRSQPDMYTIFTWVDQTRVPPDASVVAELKAPPVPRRKIENRWETEAAYQYGGGNKSWGKKTEVANKIDNEKPQTQSRSSVSDREQAPTSGEQRVSRVAEESTHHGTSHFDAEKPAAAAAEAPSTKQSFTEKQRKIRAAKKRSELRKAAKGGGEGGLPSRALADTAYAEICKKPAFHNYGRANAAGSWSPEQHLTHNAKAAAKIREKIGAPPQLCPPPAPLADGKKPVKPKHASYKAATVPKNKRANAPVVAPSAAVAAVASTTAELNSSVDSMPMPAAPPPAPTVQSTLAPPPPPPVVSVPGDANLPSTVALNEQWGNEVEEGGSGSSPERAAGVPLARSSPVRLGGRSSHVRAARVQMAPLDKPRPEALNKLAGGAENDPKNYRFLSNEWTGLITPAGTANPTGVTVSDCLDLFE